MWDQLLYLNNSLPKSKPKNEGHYSLINLCKYKRVFTKLQLFSYNFSPILILVIPKHFSKKLAVCTVLDWVMSSAVKLLIALH